MSDPVRTFDTVRTAVREWAGKEHAKKNQTWSEGRPYLDHLDAVEAVLVRFGFDKPKSLEHQALRIAAYAHDLLEDTEVTVDRVRWYLGEEVAALVMAVTNEEGKNRAERHLKTYPKTKATPWAVVLKLAEIESPMLKSVSRPTAPSLACMPRNTLGLLRLCGPPMAPRPPCGSTCLFCLLPTFQTPLPLVSP